MVAEARAALKSQKTDLILLDVNLPDGNGMDFIREIRRQCQTPIILLTVNDIKMALVMGLEAGANDYITKPFGRMTLKNSKRGERVSICLSLER